MEISRMKVQYVSILLVAFLFLLAVTGTLAAISIGRPARAQAQELAGDKDSVNALTIEEVRALVRELESQAEAQRIQVLKTEASLKRAQTLLIELIGGDHAPET